MRAVERDNAIIRAWIRAAVYSTDGNVDRSEIPNRWQCTRVSYDHRAIYSYGTHFPIAEVYRHGRRVVILLNGDEWRGPRTRTPDHQAAAREQAALHYSADTLIVPFSALDGAGIDRASVLPVHVRSDVVDRFTLETTVPSDFLPPSARPTDEELAVWDSPATEPLRRTYKRTAPFEVRASGDADAMARAGIAARQTRTLEIRRHDVWKRWDYSAGEIVQPCRTCEGTGTLDRTGADRRCWSCGGKGSTARKGSYVTLDPPDVVYTIGGSWQAPHWNETAEGVVLRWDETRHWLGDSLFTAVRVTRERCPHGTEPFTYCERCRARVSSVGNYDRRRRRQRFLSSFDYQERQPLYFLAALPTSSRAETVESAFQDLAPRAVHAAYARDVDVARQGDVFAIATPLTTAEVYAMAVRRSFLSTETHGRRPRKGEVGHRPPFTSRQLATMRRKRAAYFREELRRLEETTRANHRRRPEWRRAKRRELGEIRAAIERHTARVAAGEDTCQCDNGYNSHGEACETCGHPRYWYRYTADNAASVLERETARYREVLARRRYDVDRYAMASRAIRVWNASDEGYLTDGNRARAAWARAVARVEEEYRVHLDPAPVRATLAIYGTAHTATEVVIARGGVTYVRGIMRHRPELVGERRDSDHAPVKLGDGDTWYLVVRNTVPRQ